MHPAAQPFDPIEHHRQRTRKAEARANAAEHNLNQLIRITALMLTDRYQDTHVNPLQLLQAWVDLDATAQELKL